MAYSVPSSEEHDDDRDVVGAVNFAKDDEGKMKKRHGKNQINLSCFLWQTEVKNMGNCLFRSFRVASRPEKVNRNLAPWNALRYSH